MQKVYVVQIFPVDQDATLVEDPEVQAVFSEFDAATKYAENLMNIIIENYSMRNDGNTYDYKETVVMSSLSADPAKEFLIKQNDNKTMYQINVNCFTVDEELHKLERKAN